MKKEIITSDLSGERIENGLDMATVVIKFEDQRRGMWEIHALADEVEEIARKGRRVRRRGRPVSYPGRTDPAKVANDSIAALVRRRELDHA